jgi:hypothetical protein
MELSLVITNTNYQPTTTETVMIIVFHQIPLALIQHQPPTTKSTGTATTPAIKPNNTGTAINTAPTIKIKEQSKAKLALCRHCAPPTNQVMHDGDGVWVRLAQHVPPYRVRPLVQGQRLGVLRVMRRESSRGFNRKLH